MAGFEGFTCFPPQAEAQKRKGLKAAEKRSSPVKSEEAASYNPFRRILRREEVHTYPVRGYNPEEWTLRFPVKGSDRDPYARERSSLSRRMVRHGFSWKGTMRSSGTGPLPVMPIARAMPPPHCWRDADDDKESMWITYWISTGILERSSVCTLASTRLNDWFKECGLIC